MIQALEEQRQTADSPGSFSNLIRQSIPPLALLQHPCPAVVKLPHSNVS
jgi:hypothetical protein